MTLRTCRRENRLPLLHVTTIITSFMHGIEHGKLILADYDPRWSILFEQEQTRLTKLIGDPKVEIEHIGSTSVPGLLAKPIIDIAILFEDEPALWYIATKVVALGYHFRGPHEQQSHWYAVYNKGPKRLFHLHIFQKDSAACRKHLMFRDKLRASRDHVVAYVAAKVTTQGKKQKIFLR